MKVYNIIDKTLEEDFIKYCVTARKNNLEVFNENIKKNGDTRIHKNRFKGKINGTGKLILCEETGERYKGTRDVCYRMGWDISYSSAISQNCRGKMKTCRGFHFSYVEGK